MKDTMKTKRLVARIDEETLEIIQRAFEISGIPVSEITRKGAVNEAIRVLSIFGVKLKNKKGAK